MLRPLLGIFFFNDTATTEIYTLSLHDALPIDLLQHPGASIVVAGDRQPPWVHARIHAIRSEEHTSELQSPCNLVCRLLLEKKKKQTGWRNRGEKKKPTRPHT